MNKICNIEFQKLIGLRLRGSDINELLTQCGIKQIKSLKPNNTYIINNNCDYEYSIPIPCLDNYCINPLLHTIQSIDTRGVYNHYVQSGGISQDDLINKTMELLTFIGEKLGQTPVVRPDIGVGWCCLNSQDRQLWCKFSLNEDKTKYILSYRSKIGHVVSEIEEIYIDFDDKIYKDDILEYSMEEIFT